MSEESDKSKGMGPGATKIIKAHILKKKQEAEAK